ncbi:MAG: HPF/RaiA family ribosome-associated protein [Burkholderiaceae bacterium]
MQVKINTDKNIECHAPLTLHIETVVKSAVDHFSGQITRVEVHLSDENAHKSGDSDLRCLMEARLQGYQPVAVTEHATTMHKAIQGAADKLKRAIENAVGRLSDNKKGRQLMTEPADDLDD